jgi:hypothetical protein
MENLCRGRYLPVEVAAGNLDEEKIHRGMIMGIHTHIKAIVYEPDFGTAKPEVLCCIHELREMWDRKVELKEEVLPCKH